MTCYARFDDMTWPLPGEDLSELEWRMRYRTSPSREDCLVAASVISAFSELVTMSERRRRPIIAALRSRLLAACGLDPAAKEKE